MSDLIKPELFTSQCTVTNREIFTFLQALNFAKVGNKQNSHRKKSLDFKRRDEKSKFPKCCHCYSTQHF